MGPEPVGSAAIASPQPADRLLQVMFPLRNRLGSDMGSPIVGFSANKRAPAISAAKVLGCAPVVVISPTWRLPMRSPLTDAAEPMPGSMLPAPASTAL